ncbi:hypothetical protein CSKR_200185 [Clonorchis sinensis]|uniref:F-box domain-containing protein n=1 Tax=Clonorchis sinensis TaxID=79923 RepID=A0A8T1LZU4_CLOSI|nr:hypothetical protein CSKR_200185 [Clonorchis sinensis]
MPSRSDAHAFRDSAAVYTTDQKATSYSVSSPKLATEHVTRHRLRRTRFTSGGGTVEPDVTEDCVTHRARRSSNAHGSGHLAVRNSKPHLRPPNSLPSSPNSACSLIEAVRQKTAVILDPYVSQNDTSINRVEQLEDENSFSSSVFSEHLASSDLPHMISAISRVPNSSQKSRHSSLLSSDVLLADDEDTKDTDQVEFAHKIKTDMDNLLIQEDSEISTPALAVTDDPGSSEGEDDNDGKEPPLVETTDSRHHLSVEASDADIMSASETPLLVDPCGDSHDYQNDSILGSGVFGCVQTAVSRTVLNVDASSRLSTDTASKSPGSHNNHTGEVLTTAATSFHPQVPVDCSTSTGSARMVTRSRTAELFRQTVNTSPLSCLDTPHFGSTVHKPLFTERLSHGADASSPQTQPSSSSATVQSLHKIANTTKRHSSPIVPFDEFCEDSARTAFRHGCQELVHPPELQTTTVTSLDGTHATPLLSRAPDITYGGSFSSPNSKNPEHTQLAFFGATALSNSDETGWQNSSVAVMTSSTPQSTIDHHHHRVPIRTSSEGGNMLSSLTSPCRSYPLRSRLRRESMLREWQAAQTAPKSFSHLPTEVVFRIVHYLSIQDAFRLQLINRRLKAIVERYLLLVKRINFSNGLPFAFLPESITDSALKRILSRTPEVTHILGFYPKRILGSHPADFHSLGNTRSGPNNALTYAGIISAFRICPRLRSVELMDVELMSKLVHYLPRIKFHGMFRNRPDSWDSEYAVPLPPESEPLSPTVAETVVENPSSCSISLSSSTDNPACQPHSDPEPPGVNHLSNLCCSLMAATAVATSYPKSKSHKLFGFKRLKSGRRSSSGAFSPPPVDAIPSTPGSSSGNSIGNSAAAVAQRYTIQYADLASWFEPLGESPVGHGSPSTIPQFLPSRSLTPWLDRPPHQRTIPTINILDGLRNMAIAPFLQPGLPPIEAEVITGPLIGPTDPADGPPIALNHHAPVMALALRAVFVPPHLPNHGVPAPILIAPHGPGPDGLALGHPPQDERRMIWPQPQGQNIALPMGPPAAFDGGVEARHIEMHNQQPRQAPVVAQPVRIAPNPIFAGRSHRRHPIRHYVRHIPATGRLSASGPWLVSPLPSHANWIALPHAITNLTKLDLVSVAISAIPRLDNIKYLHLKWVVFTSADPFFNFSATKLQSFVMNNCSGPSRAVRFVRIFSALARAPQLTRLELVGIRFVDGLLAHIIDVPLLPGRGFRNLQRLVLSSNREASEFDVGLMLLAGQQSLSHVALQIAHTRNSLFESLWCARAGFPRLETLILGYQDPYQSRLTVSELLGLGVGEASDHLMPLCGLTDWGLSVVFRLCPRLASLTIRHAPYLSSVLTWHDRSSDNWVLDEPGGGANADLSQAADEAHSNRPPAPNHAQPHEGQEAAEDTVSTKQPTDAVGDPQYLLLRSLTLENCPGISIESLEDAITSGTPFPCLETLVLRDMFLPRCDQSRDVLRKPTWIERRACQAKVNFASNCPSQPLEVDWCRVAQLQALSDLLATRHLSYSSTCPESIGLASSVQNVTASFPSGGVRDPELALKPFDLFYSLRTRHYLSSLLELDGSCGPRSLGQRRFANALFGPLISTAHAVPLETPHNVEFVSQSTQTCICGTLEWNVFNDLVLLPSTISADSACSSSAHPTRPHVGHSVPTDVSSTDQAQQLGGPLAFHPFPPSILHQELFKIVTASEWTQHVLQTPPMLQLASLQSTRIPVSPGDCPGCVSDTFHYDPNSQSPSSLHFETDLQHRPRKWLARDAATDTTELRCHTFPGPLAFTVLQTPGAPFSNLTSIHFEKVGLSHLVLSGAPHLKNVTLENCPQLQAILLAHPSVPMDAETVPTTLPSLRRIRVIRCPKFAIYYLLNAIASMYPSHDENVSIIYRPFGHYDERVEKALWDRAHHAHVLISHDYKLHESEREMEEFHSSFDQLFREVINFADMLVRRELLQVHPKPNTVLSSPPSFRRSEHGASWDLVTDIPWIHEICCSFLRGSEPRQSDQADQFYEVLSEIQTASNPLKLQRRGIHLHVQFRDIHSSLCPVSASSERPSEQAKSTNPLPQSYLKWPSTDQFLTTTHPALDPNVWGDGYDEAMVAALPPRETKPTHSWSSLPISDIPSWQRLLLSQEEPDHEGIRDATNPPDSHTPSNSGLTVSQMCDQVTKPIATCEPAHSSSKRPRLERDITAAVWAKLKSPIPIPHSTFPTSSATCTDGSGDGGTCRKRPSLPYHVHSDQTVTKKPRHTCHKLN